MHELSLCEGIVSAVERTAERHGVAKIESVRVAVGRLAGVDIPSLEFAWRSVTMTGPLTGAKLVIERPKGTAYCTDCGETVPLAKFGDACPKCGGFRLIPNGGTELKVLDFVPAEDEAEASEPETN